MICLYGIQKREEPHTPHAPTLGPFSEEKCIMAFLWGIDEHCGRRIQLKPLFPPQRRPRQNQQTVCLGKQASLVGLLCGVDMTDIDSLTWASLLTQEHQTRDSASPRDHIYTLLLAVLPAQGTACWDVLLKGQGIVWPSVTSCGRQSRAERSHAWLGQTKEIKEMLNTDSPLSSFLKLLTDLYQKNV